MLDVIFLSFFEENAEENWWLLKEKVPHAQRVENISPIGAAHRECANIARTNYFYVVDGDAKILDSFEFDFIPNPKVRWPGGNFQDKYVYVWRSLNPVNNLVYGYGGVKLFPRMGVLNHTVWKPDFATSVAEAFRPMPEISNITAFDFSEYNTWKSAFRECSKLQSKVIKNQKDDETELRLWSWRTQCGNHKFGEWAHLGAEDAHFFVDAGHDVNLINNFEFLKRKFDTSYGNPPTLRPAQHFIK